MDFNQMGEMLSQAREMQQQMEEKLQQTVVEATSGGGAVTARVNGRKELLKLTIDPSAVASAAGDITMLEDLITAAVNQAGQKADEAMQTSAAGLLGGLNLPGL